MENPGRLHPKSVFLGAVDREIGPKIRKSGGVGDSLVGSGVEQGVDVGQIVRRR